MSPSQRAINRARRDKVEDRFAFPTAGGSVRTEDSGLIYKLLRTRATPPSSDMGVDGSVTPVEFFFTPSRDGYISRFLFTLLAATAGDGSKFMSLAALTNGVRIEIVDRNGDVVEGGDFLDGEPIKRNVDWGRLAGVDVGLETKHLIIRWSLFKTGAALNLRVEQRIRLTVQDDLSSLTVFQTAVQGYYP